MPIAAAVAGGVLSVGGSLIAGSSAKSAANTAAAAQREAAQLGIEEQRRQYDLTRGDLMPWQTAGTTALGQQGDLLGLNGVTSQEAAINGLRESPLYQALFDNGENTILANASATGGLRGGNTQRSLANFGRDTLAQVIEGQIAKLGNVSGQGQNAAAQTGAFGQNSANAITQLLGDQGAATAGAATASGAINAGMIKDITGAITGLAGNSGIQKSIGKLF